MSFKLTLSSRLKELRPTHLSKLALMLDPYGAWKELASKIKTRNGLDMFDTDIINNISHRTAMTGGSPTKEIICSWFTSNPSIADLRMVLQEINASRAVTYINEEILRVPSGVSDTTGNENRDDTSSPAYTEPIVAPTDGTNDGNMFHGCEKFSYKFLQQVTDDFSSVPLSDGGRLLGEGGFGEVFKGIHHNYPDMAVKRFLRVFDEVDVRLSLKQFKTELTVLSQCKHENLLPLIGYCDEEQQCVVYQYMVNGSLEDRLACKNGTHSLQVPVRLNIIKGVTRGLCYLHSLSPPLIHRDIKTANILLDSKFVAKIGDCGTVREGPRGNKTSTRTQANIGTCPYMPKEYLEDYEVSVKMDAYSLGVVLLEVLTGLPVLDDSREDRSLPTHIRETVENHDISPLLDTKAGEWGPHLPHDMYKISMEFMEYKSRRLTVKQALPQIESWKEP